MNQNHNVACVNLRFIKPLDMETLEPLIKRSRHITVLEEGSRIGGVYSYILSECRHLNRPLSDFSSYAIPDRFIDHGTVSELHNEIGITQTQIKDDLLTKVSSKNKVTIS